MVEEAESPPLVPQQVMPRAFAASLSRERFVMPVVMTSLRFGSLSMSAFCIDMRSRISTTTSKGASAVAA